jgi:hypothetical protein
MLALLRQIIRPLERAGAAATVAVQHRGGYYTLYTGGRGGGGSEADCCCLLAIALETVNSFESGALRGAQLLLQRQAN